MGADIFRTFCQSEPEPLQPAKVRVTATSHGNRVTGNEVGRSEKVTGDEPGTCKSITGTEYISANQAAAYCGTTSVSPRKVGHSQTLAGRPVSGVMVGRSERVTGDEQDVVNLVGPIADQAALQAHRVEVVRGKMRYEF